MRERLIELLNYIPCKAESCAAVDGGRCGDLDNLNRCQIEAIANYLLENGVVVLPCKVGQKVWMLMLWSKSPAEIIEGKVSMLQQKADGTWKIRITRRSSVEDITPDEIGKTVFLTREEAERALRKEDEGK